MYVAETYDNYQFIQKMNVNYILVNDTDVVIKRALFRPLVA